VKSGDEPAGVGRVEEAKPCDPLEYYVESVGASYRDGDPIWELTQKPQRPPAGPSAAEWQAMQARSGWRIMMALVNLRIKLAPSGSRRDRAAKFVLRATTRLLERASGKRPVEVLSAPETAEPATPAISLWDLDYLHWLRRRALSEYRLRTLKRAAEQLAYKPLLSVVIPAYNTRPEWLREGIDSVRRQIYPLWELCIADDASSDEGTRTVLSEYERLDDRIQVVWRSENGGIAAASNDALAIAHGEFVGFLDHDDELKPDALLEVVRLLNERPDLDFVYSDEDKKDVNGRLVEAFFKPDWSPDLLLCKNFVTHFSVYRRELLERIGGFRTGYEGSQDWDLVLRATEMTDRVGHVPKPLYTWRRSPGSTAADMAAKPYAWEAGKRAIRDSLERRGQIVEVVDGIGLSYRVVYPLKSGISVVVVIAGSGAEALQRCSESVRRLTSFRPYELVVVDSRGEADLPAKLNEAVRELDRSVDALVFLSGDAEVRSPGWIEALVEQGQREDVGVVGARVFGPDGRAQHEGVVIGMHGAASRVGHDGYFSMGEAVRNVSAVAFDGLLTRLDVFRGLGGFDEAMPVDFYDVDYCLRAREKGYLVVFTPYAELEHRIGWSNGLGHTFAAVEAFNRRWRGYEDPYYNPNFSLTQPFRLDLDD
jgi:GT2 family glycosyltransferase